jgi:hypothetical protein
MPQPPLPEYPAPSSAPKACKASKPLAGKFPSNPPAATLTQHLTVFVVKVLAASQLLNTVPHLVKHTHSNTLPASDDGSNAVRIAMLESRQDELEKWACRVDHKLKQLGM